MILSIIEISITNKFPENVTCTKDGIMGLQQVHKLQLILETTICKTQ
jgi:hypothetical protein